MRPVSTSSHHFSSRAPHSIGSSNLSLTSGQSGYSSGRPECQESVRVSLRGDARSPRLYIYGSIEYRTFWPIADSRQDPAAGSSPLLGVGCLRRAPAGSAREGGSSGRSKQGVPRQGRLGASSHGDEERGLAARQKRFQGQVFRSLPNETICIDPNSTKRINLSAHRGFNRF